MIIVIFLFWIFFAILVGIYGRNKGQGFAGSFILSIILSPLIGFLIIAAIAAGGKKKCIYCAENINKKAKICHFCGKEQPKEQPGHLKDHMKDYIKDRMKLALIGITILTIIIGLYTLVAIFF